LLAGPGVLEHCASELDAVRLEVSDVAARDLLAPAPLGVGDGRAAVEPGVAQLAEVLGAHVVVIGLRGMAEDRVVELEEVPPAGGAE
jgi:hypothetical protein